VVIRDGIARSAASAPPLAPGDYVLALARPKDLALLDRVFPFLLRAGGVGRVARAQMHRARSRGTEGSNPAPSGRSPVRTSSNQLSSGVDRRRAIAGGVPRSGSRPALATSASAPIQGTATIPVRGTAIPATAIPHTPIRRLRSVLGSQFAPVRVL
jgi:hypothetical protein